MGGDGKNKKKAKSLFCCARGGDDFLPTKKHVVKALDALIHMNTLAFLPTRQTVSAAARGTPDGAPMVASTSNLPLTASAVVFVARGVGENLLHHIVIFRCAKGKNFSRTSLSQKKPLKKRKKKSGT